MKKVFISQPMNGKTDAQIKSTRRDMAMILRNYFEEDIKVLDSVIEEAPKDAQPLWYLGKSLEILSTADVAAFARGWEKYRGCRLEHTCAVEYGIRIIEL